MNPDMEEEIIPDTLYGNVSPEYIHIYTSEYNHIYLTNAHAQEVFNWLQKKLFT